MADTVFWTSLAISVVVAAMIALLARPIAGLFDEPRVAPLLVALGAVLIVSVAGATHIALMLREFGHKAMATRSVVSNIVGGGAALAAASAGWGAWSLLVAARRDRAGRHGDGLAGLPLVAGPRLSRPRCCASCGASASRHDLYPGSVRGAGAGAGRHHRPHHRHRRRRPVPNRVADRRADRAGRDHAVQPGGATHAGTAPGRPARFPQAPTFASQRLFRRRRSRRSSGFAVLAPDAIPLVFGSQWGPARRSPRCLASWRCRSS